MSGTLLRLLAGRWIAGETIEDAVNRAAELNKHGVTAIINYLGEEYEQKDNVDDAVRTYLSLIDAIKAARVKAEISVKATQIGLLLGMEVAKKNYKSIVEHGKKNGVYVWMDMEEYETIPKTIELFKSEIGSHNTGLCLQSCHKRTEKDLESLAKLGADVRLVKGAHKLHDGLSYPTRQEATENYVELMNYMFWNMKNFTVGTHDQKLIGMAMTLEKKYKRNMTIAMLNGIRADYALRLARKTKVSVYVPFGPKWFGYSYRRLKEMSNLKLIIRSIFSG